MITKHNTYDNKAFYYNTYDITLMIIKHNTYDNKAFYYNTYENKA